MPQRSLQTRHLLFNLYLQTVRLDTVPETLDVVGGFSCTSSPIPPILGQGRDGGQWSWSPSWPGLCPIPHTPPQLCKLDVSLFHLDLPSPGCRIPQEPPEPTGPSGQLGPSRGRFPPWALVWSEGVETAVPAGGLGQGTRRLPQLDVFRLEPADGPGVVTGVASGTGGAHTRGQAARGEDAEEEGAPEGHSQQGQHQGHGLGRAQALAAGVGGCGGLGAAGAGCGP